MEVEAQGKTFTFPDGTTNGEIGEAIDDYFAKSQVSEPQPAPSLMDEAIGYAEPALTVASGLVAEPAAGIAGIGAMGVNEIFNFFRNGRKTTDVAVDTINATRDALTYQPRTELGQENLQAVGEALAPVGEAIQDIEQGAGDIGYELGGKSPVMGAIGTALPTAAMTALGLRPVREAAKTATGVNRATSALRESSQAKQASKLLQEAAPTESVLKESARDIYKQLDSNPATIKGDSVSKLSGQISNAMAKKGYHPKLYPSVKVALDELDLAAKGDIPISRLNQLREFANKSASDLDPKTKMLGVTMINKMDDFMDGLKKDDFSVEGGDVGAQYRSARNLWGRGKRAELLNDAVTKADSQASGFENGLRIQFRKIVDSPKKSRYFNKSEIQGMREVIQGTAASNMSKLLGKFGFDPSRAANMTGGSIGAAGGGAVFGPAGVVAIPAVGTAARQLSKGLTKKSADKANAMVRAGTDGKKIVREYMNRTAKRDRNAKELGEFLLNSESGLDEVRKLPLKSLSKQQKGIVKDAILYADLMRQSSSEPSNPGSVEQP